jgi:hypothetical protein
MRPKALLLNLKRSLKDLRLPQTLMRTEAFLGATFDRAACAPGVYQRIFNNGFGEVPISEGAQRALKALDKRSEATARMEANLKAPENAAKEPSPLLTHVRDKFKKTKRTAVPRIPLDQRLVDPSSLERNKSPDSLPSPARTVKPDDPNEDAEMQAEGNQNVASTSF